jgi:hypothetical protein
MRVVGLAKLWLQERSGATQRPRREEHAAPPESTTAVTLLERLGSEPLFTLKRVQHCEGARGLSVQNCTLFAQCN